MLPDLVRFGPGDFEFNVDYIAWLNAVDEALAASRPDVSTTDLDQNAKFLAWSDGQSPEAFARLPVLPLRTSSAPSYQEGEAAEEEEPSKRFALKEYERQYRILSRAMGVGVFMLVVCLSGIFIIIGCAFLSNLLRKKVAESGHDPTEWERGLLPHRHRCLLIGFLSLVVLFALFGAGILELIHKAITQGRAPTPQ